MSDDQILRADQALEAAIAASGARDPREYLRKTLRELKESNSAAYQEAVDYYRSTLVPSVASGELEPLPAWREYGRKLAFLAADGRTVEIDDTGRARPAGDDPDIGSLVLHIPDGKKPTRALLVSFPADPSPAQRASHDLLVLGKQRSAD